MTSFLKKLGPVAVATAAALLPSLSAGQQTLSVPAQYPSVAAAVAAAAAGDTIVLDSSASCPATNAGYGDLVIDKNLRIVGRPAAASLTLYSVGVFGSPPPGGGGALRLAGATPIDVTFDNLTITFRPNEDGSFPMNESGLRGIANNVEILSCTIRELSLCHTVQSLTSVVTLTANRLCIRDSTIFGHSPAPEMPCIDANCVGFGSSALHFAGEQLIIEDSRLEAGDAALRPFPWSGGVGCNPPWGVYGGAPAVASTATRAILRGVTLRNGHASWLEPAPWLPPTLTTVQNAQAVASTLGGEQHLWDVTELLGWDARIASPRPSSSAATDFLGGYDNLRLHGEARIGGSFTMDVSSQLWNGFGVVGLSTGLLPPPTFPGGLLIDISDLLIIDLVGAIPPAPGLPLYSRTVPIPLDATLIGSFLPAQVARFDGWLGNVSCIVLRTP